MSHKSRASQENGTKSREMAKNRNAVSFQKNTWHGSLSFLSETEQAALFLVYDNHNVTENADICEQLVNWFIEVM